MTQMTITMRAVIVVASCVFLATARTVTIFNNQSRLDVSGAYVDAHDGMILAHGSPPTYYMYGEAYNDTTGSMYPWPSAPMLAVYTSPDMVQWTYRGPALVDAGPGTQWIPNVFFDERSGRFIMWYGTGDWTVAVSYDGIAFNVVNSHITSRLGGQTDGTGIFIDDDGTGYVIFAALVTNPGTSGHLVSIERLADDYLSSSKINVTGFFPDGLVESPALFKRGSTYYATYGTCCCACRIGSGVVIFTAPSVSGPWTRQYPYADVNCNNPTATICGAYANRDSKDLVFNAQWWGASLIPSSSGNTTVMFTGRRWLSGPGNPAGCNDMCSNGGNPDACKAPNYYLRSDFDVWYPLEFSEDGHVLPFHPLPAFNLDLP